MKKHLILLMAALMILLCACRQTQPDNVIFPSPDQPSPQSTAQDSAAPEQSGLKVFERFSPA